MTQEICALAAQDMDVEFAVLDGCDPELLASIPEELLPALREAATEVRERRRASWERILACRDGLRSIAGMPAEGIVWAREEHGWDLAGEAVRRRPEDIVLVPERALFPHVCAEAVRRKVAVLRFVPEGMRTPYVCCLPS